MSNDEKNKKDLITKEDASNITSFRSGAVHKVGIGAKLHKARAEGTLIQNITEKKNRIMICLDDSGSMADYVTLPDGSGQQRMEQAKEAVKGFLTACNAVDTAVGVHAFSSNTVMPLTVVYSTIIKDVSAIHATGGTPLYESIQSRANDDPAPTRMVAISDGAPNSFGYNYETGTHGHVEMLKKIAAKGIIVDAVFIGDEDETSAISVMKEIAELTGGKFIHFKPGTSFTENFKYLAPAYYGLLADPNFVKRIEG